MSPVSTCRSVEAGLVHGMLACSCMTDLRPDGLLQAAHAQWCAIRHEMLHFCLDPFLEQDGQASWPGCPVPSWAQLALETEGYHCLTTALHAWATHCNARLQSGQHLFGVVRLTHRLDKHQFTDDGPNVLRAPCLSAGGLSGGN